VSAIVYAYNIDNLGNMVVLPHCAHPVLASGQTLTATTAGTNYTATVKCGHNYVVTATVGTAFFGVTGTIATAANREWICGQGGKITLHIPQISTGAATRTLNYGGNTDATVIYLVECAERD
jgi:hypothetical protein